ncbi:MAG: glycosyltransferase [Candidatus Methanoperedens sp.]|nr:glycosyltransferase [Candidatus Methanoperedens sp.]
MQRKRDLVSCIVPVLNEEETILNFILSLHRQDYRPIELIIVDGGSMDDTINIINTSRDDLNDESFSLRFFEEKDFGTIASPANARNIGLDKAEGEFIFFIDSDTCFISNSTISAAITEIGNRDFIIIYFKPIIDTKLEEYISKTIKMDGIILYRKRIIKNIRFNPTLGFGEDREFNFRLFGNLRFDGQIPCSETIGRHHPHTKTELKRQNEWYGRTIIRYLSAVYPVNKKEFVNQTSYVFYNFFTGLFPFFLIISLVILPRFAIILLILFTAQILVRFLKYKWNNLDQYVFLIWYSIFNGFFFIKGMILGSYKKNIAGRNS